MRGTIQHACRVTRPVERICVLRFGAMGDILLTTPAVRALSRRYPSARIDFVVGKGAVPIVTGIPYISRTIEFDKLATDALPFGFLAFLKGLREADYDLFVNFQPSVKTRVMAFASAAPRVLTFQKDRHIHPETGHMRHAVDDFYRVLEPLGVSSLGSSDRRLDFVVSPDARARVADLLREEGLEESDTLVLVNPGASHPVNRWPPERIAEFFAAAGHDFPVSVRMGLIGGSADVASAEAIWERIPADIRPRVMLLTGRLNVKELGAVIERASVVVTADTGPMHVASAVGTPIVALFGPADPFRTGPVGPTGKHLVVVNKDGLDCVPCRRRSCARGDTACMTQLSVERVLSAVQTQLARARDRVAA